MSRFFHGRPEALVAHDDGVDDAVGVEGELVLAQDAELARAHNGALLRVKFPGEQLHERGLARAVGPGQAVVAPGGERGGDIFEQNFGAVAHRNIADRNHRFLEKLREICLEAGRSWLSQEYHGRRDFRLFPLFVIPTAGRNLLLAAATHPRIPILASASRFLPAVGLTKGGNYKECAAYGYVPAGSPCPLPAPGFSATPATAS